MAAPVREKPQTVQAKAKFVRISPRKARLVTDNIRGRSVPEARTILAFTDRAAAVEIEKVLSSAVANAESNPALHWRGDGLVVHAVYVDEGPTLKRWRARARGRTVGERENRARLGHAAPANIVGHQARLARRDADELRDSLHRLRPFTDGSSHQRFFTCVFWSPAWPRK